jgi:hypothetical protein
MVQKWNRVSQDTVGIQLGFYIVRFRIELKNPVISRIFPAQPTNNQPKQGFFPGEPFFLNNT